MTRKSPFKFLDAYSKEDGNIFHGREAEIQALYDMAHESNLILVYGRSGTGKTSLIQCGLANRFKAADWMDIYVRRKGDINKSLIQALVDRLPEDDDEEEGGLLDEFMEEMAGSDAVTSETKIDKSNVVSLLTALNKSYFKPIYLIFDQFEELFILGNPEERRKFYRTVRQIKKMCPFCHVILALREESIAELSQLERYIPDLFEKRLRVEPLGRAKAIEVVEKTCADFDILLNGVRIDPENIKDYGTEPNAAAAKIVTEISKGRGRTELTYLQVFLDALWNDSYESGDDPIDFSVKDIEGKGITDVLGDFLIDQSNNLQSSLEEKYPGVAHDTVSILLNEFVSSENTKRPMAISELGLQGISREQVQYCLDELEQARILRFDGDKYYELSHDALADKIVAERKDEDIAYFEMIRIVKDTYRSYDTTGDIFLSTNQLALYDEHAERAQREGKLTANEIDFVEISQREIDKKRRRARRYAIAAVAFMTIVAAVFIYLLIDANRESYDKYVVVGKNALKSTEYEQAIAALNDARSISRRKAERDSLGAMIEQAETYLQDKPEFDTLMNQADMLSRINSEYTYLETCDRLLAAFDKYVEADALSTNDTDQERLNRRVQALRSELNYRQRELETKANVMFDAISDKAEIEAQRLEATINKIRNTLNSVN